MGLDQLVDDLLDAPDGKLFLIGRLDVCGRAELPLGRVSFVEELHVPGGDGLPVLVDLDADLMVRDRGESINGGH